MTDSGGPSYISSHSADVILSDIRPIKLKVEALRSINILLDEFLYNILSTSRSLSTDRLRASLLSLLPTTLGKEALLEAEVELRAYWDRTEHAGAHSSPLEDDTKNFDLQWAFELLRLKCEAYSTLNETDEDPEVEDRINEKMAAMGAAPPSLALMAPAALYLTAILEALCEHILSNIGRVAARDSSRTSATINDLFTALCEDHTIYSLFKTMKVYDQIEQLSNAPKSRRSKSISQSRTSSPHPDTLQNVKDGTTSQSGHSSETSTMVSAAPLPSNLARSSLEKSKAIKVFKTNSRTSMEKDFELIGHKRTDSSRSDNKQSMESLGRGSPAVENETMQHEFDQLMRSSSTMKVSLTPDRLKTMEAYKQEKDQRGNRRPDLITIKTDIAELSSVPPRLTGRRPSLIRVESIKEDDDEDNSPKLSRPRQASVSTPRPAQVQPSRTRAISTSGAAQAPTSFKTPRKAVPPIANPSQHSPSTSMQYGHPKDGFPARTRKIQRNRESMDLDDVMAGSDDDDLLPPTAPSKVPPPVTSPRREGQYSVSANTRDLMDFLAQGPPEDPRPSAPPEHADAGKPKGAGGLRRIISRLYLSGGAEKKGGSDDLQKGKTSQPQTPLKQPATSVNGLSSLANRPVPPRPPPVPHPISPPSSPSHDSSDDHSISGSRPRGASVVKSKRSFADVHTPHTPEANPPVPVRESGDSVSSSTRKLANGHNTKSTAVDDALRATSTVSPTSSVPSSPQVSMKRHAAPSSPTRKHVPTAATSATQPHIAGAAALEMHQLISRATNVDECRLICEMFLARAGISASSQTDYTVPYPSPSPSVIRRKTVSAEDNGLENMVVELFLGENEEPDSPHLTTKRKMRKKSKYDTAKIPASPPPQIDHAGSHNANGNAQQRKNETLADDKEQTDASPHTNAYNHASEVEVAT